MDEEDPGQDRDKDPESESMYEISSQAAGYLADEKTKK
jgi:hypothetical protein